MKYHWHWRQLLDELCIFLFFFHCNAFKHVFKIDVRSEKWKRKRIMEWLRAHVALMLDVVRNGNPWFHMVSVKCEPAAAASTHTHTRARTCSQSSNSTSFPLVDFPFEVPSAADPLNKQQVVQRDHNNHFQSVCWFTYFWYSVNSRHSLLKH